MVVQCIECITYSGADGCEKDKMYHTIHSGVEGRVMDQTCHTVVRIVVKWFNRITHCKVTLILLQ